MNDFDQPSSSLPVRQAAIRRRQEGVPVSGSAGLLERVLYMKRPALSGLQVSECVQNGKETPRPALHATGIPIASGAQLQDLENMLERCARRLARSQIDHLFPRASLLPEGRQDHPAIFVDVSWPFRQGSCDVDSLEVRFLRSTGAVQALTFSFENLYLGVSCLAPRFGPLTRRIATRYSAHRPASIFCAEKNWGALCFGYYDSEPERLLSVSLEYPDGV